MLPNMFMFAVYGRRAVSHRKWAPNAGDSVVSVRGHLVKMSRCGIGVLAVCVVDNMGG